MGGRGMHVGVSRACRYFYNHVFMASHQTVSVMGKALNSYGDRMIRPILAISRLRTGTVGP